jgi:putative zinc finger/helix-turn-helix YgiT family protein
MIGFCPSCEKESELINIRKQENFNVKGEMIPVDVDYFTCTECGAEFDNPNPGYDPLAVAYRKYRRRKHMMQPEEIRSFRETYDLTQRELSLLLGFGGATLSRYENGALQDETHDTLLRLILQPANLLEIIQEKPEVLAEEKRKTLIDRIEDDLLRSELLASLWRRPGYRGKSFYNGFREFDPDRLLAATKILCFQKGVYKTKLNKLLFYSDFKCYQVTGISLTGVCYARIPFGPVPDQYELLFQKLLEMDPTLVMEEVPMLDGSAEYFRCDAEPDKACFSLSEIEILMKVKRHFNSFSTKAIADYSHQEVGYIQTGPNELISYAFADQLSI